MKIIYSHLKTFLPNLNVTPQKLRDDITMIGHFTNFYEEIEGEIVFDLDIKINRGDCLGYYGLARDLSVLYNIPLIIPETNLNSSNNNLPITVTSPDVTRVMCVKISNLKVSPSPDWLVKFTKIHGVNSVNNIVDLTNYIMFMYGIPNHAFDATICGDHIIWETNNNKTKEFTTLDGTVLKLSSQNLVISNPSEVLSTDLVGGKKSGTYDNTTDIIIEVAIYNRVRIRLDSKELKTITEASTRLEKDLDPETIPLAFNELASQIIKLSGGHINSKTYDYYPNPISVPTIKYDFNSASQISGINISADFAKKTLTNLGCVIARNNNNSDEAISLVTPPPIRKDITIPEDLSEEIIRFYGYNNIPTNQPITYKKTNNITPKILYLIEKTKDELVSQGYDEVITWPLIETPVDPKTVIRTENSINAEVIYLRQSLIPSLKNQLDQYSRYKLPNPKFFEIGKIYYQENGKYIEKYALGTYDGQEFKETILDDLVETLHATSLPYIPKVINNSAIELTSQIITLDANVNFTSPQDPLKLIEKYSAKINKNILWSMEITDIFENKYTFRVNYYNCDDKTAKKIHLSTFNLT